MPSFGATGKITTHFGGNDESRDVIALSDGKILVGGFVGSRRNDFGVARYNADGTLDTSFGVDGYVATDIRSNSNDVGFGMTVQSDGKIILAGFTSETGVADDFVVVRYSADGTLDTSFGAGGIVITNINNPDSLRATSGDFAYRVAVQSDGKIVVAGVAGADFAVARYNSDGTLDTSFGTGGAVFTDPSDGESINIAYGLAIQNDGKILVTGHANYGSSFAVVRYNEDGTLDTSFGNRGKIISYFNNTSSLPGSVTVQNNGKILVAGYRRSATLNFAIVRYNEDGTLDTSFGNRGEVITNNFNSSFGFVGDPPSSIEVQSDGKILVAGSRTGNTNAAIDFAIVRYNSDGTIDTSFGTDGIATTDINNSPDISYGMTVQSDGKILVVGTTSDRFRNDFTIARYNPDGTLDANFLPTSANTTVSTTANTLYTFAAADFSFTDANNDTLQAVQITSLATAGNLFLDGNDNNQADTGEAIELNQTITAADLGKLKFQADDAVNTNGASFGFKVRDAYDFSTEAYTLSIDVTAPNSAPILVGAIADQTAQAATAFRFTVPLQTFQDADSQDSLRLSATLADGNSLPNWLSFDPATGSFTGTPPQATTIALKVTAIDNSNATISDEFNLTITPASIANPEPIDPLSGQLGVLPVTSFGRITRRINGTSKADRLTGSKANDAISGRGGSDRINGGRGNDLIRGDQGSDFVIGGLGSDRIAGGTGNDQLLGGSGNDRLIGGSGRDSLTGGAGKDVFAFSEPIAAVDTIADFDRTSDLIDLRGIFARSEFQGATLSQVIRLEQIGANTEIQIDADGLGSGTNLVAIARLQNITASTLTASNFVIR